MIDLSNPSSYVTLTKFNMETVFSVLGSIRKGDFVFSVSLKDTYIKIPIHLDSQSYFWIAVEGKVYYAPYTAPQVFTRVFALVLEWTHKGGIQLLCYLDDW